MDDSPSMSPDEMAWASQNAGRPPQARQDTSAARQDTSAAFAAQARVSEHNAAMQAKVAQHRQDSEYNHTVHAQDMAAARAHHRALMGQYSVLDRARAEFGALTSEGFGWKQGFVIGLAVGALLNAIYGEVTRKRRR
jgi:hypothetical protein